MNENESEVDYKSIRRSTNKTDQVLKNQLFTLFHEAIIKPENSRNEEQKIAIKLLENVLFNK